MPSVLVIDDSEVCRAYLRTLLERAGYDVHERANGKGVDAFIAATPVDAVITDLVMPGVDGLETIRAVKRLSPFLPVIGITGVACGCDDYHIRAMTLLGATAVLTKPLDPDALLARLGLALADNGAVPRGY
jgi:CheY-like chemotaxis protein